MVRIQSSLSFIRVPSRAPGTKSASRQHSALCLGQKRQGTSTYADDQHKKEKQRASKGSRAWLREGDDPPTHLHSSTILQHACQSQVQIVSAGCAFRKQGPGLVLGYYATGPTSSSRAQGAGGGGRTPPGSQMFTYLSYTDAASVQAMNRQTAVLKRCVANMKDPKRQNQRPHFTAEKAKAQEPGPKGHSGG